MPSLQHLSTNGTARGPDGAERNEIPAAGPSYTSTFPPSKRITPIQLSQIIVVAENETSYHWASSHQHELKSYLCGPEDIHRQGDKVKIPISHAQSNGTQTNGYLGHKSPERHVSFEIVMAEPVLQGYCSDSSTEFIVTPPSDSRKGKTSSTISQSVAVDIDEDFLGASLIGGLDGEDDVGFDGTFIPASSTKQDVSKGSRTVRVASTSNLTTLPLTSEQHEDETTEAFVKTEDLGKLGLFNGDRIRIYNPKSKDYRLVTLHALNDNFYSSEQQTIYLHPVLLFNMGSPDSVCIDVPEAWQTAPFPLAASISIARVASQLSMHKRYQALILAALKTYFQQVERILKEGDLVAVPFDESLIRYETENGESNTDVEEVEEEPFELPEGTEHKNAVAYFKVTELVIRGQEAGLQGPEENLGARIEPAITTMIQTGLENSRVPDLESLLTLDGPRLQVQQQIDEMGKLTVYGRLEQYLEAAFRPDASRFGLNLTVLLKGARGAGKSTVAKLAARSVGFHVFEFDCFSLIGETDTKTEGNLAARFDKAAASTPSILLLRHIEALARKSQSVETGQEPTISAVIQDCLKVAQEAWSKSGYPLVVIGTTTDIDKIPVSVVGCFKEELMIEAPGEAQRLAMLEDILSNDNLTPDVSVKSLAVQTAALVAGDLVDLAHRARLIAIQKLAQLGLDVEACKHAGIVLTASDFTKALDQARSSYSESIGAPKIPNVTWDDVGGLAKVKTEILDTIQLPLEHPELFADGLKKRSGVLLYGPPGTGKTLLAKAVATSCSLNFFSVKGPELLNMYIGESEANVRRVFQRARDAKPCVIFFDELDSVAPKRGNQGDSGGVMDRIVSQLLAELDGMAEGSGGADVFVIGATNRPDLLDPALLRPGRFDRMLYLGVSDTHTAQLNIIEALTRKFKLHPETDLAAVAELCPFNYTGADFYALCSDAMLKAMSRKAEQVDLRIAALNATPKYEKTPLTPQYYLAELATREEIEVLVTQQDFEKALAELVPSVSAAEMEHYRLVQQRFSGDTSAKADEGTLLNGQGASKSKGKGKGKGKGKARALDQ